MSTRKQTKKETYSQLAEKFKFEADGSDTELSVDLILSAIFDGDNSTARKSEKDLAAILLRIIPKDLKILFTQRYPEFSTINFVFF